jgi:hypothetical protein
LRGALPDSLTHLTGHRFDPLIFPDRGFDAVGFQMGIESLRMVFHQVGSILVGVVSATYH